MCFQGDCRSPQAQGEARVDGADVLFGLYTMHVISAPPCHLMWLCQWIVNSGEIAGQARVGRGE